MTMPRHGADQIGTVKDPCHVLEFFMKLCSTGIVL
jgi:hypothetical protein